MSPIVRRLVYVTLYEIIAVAMVGAGLAIFLDKPIFDTGTFAVLSSGIAVIWNYVFNAMFEAWETRQSVKGRSVSRRMAHAIGFEGGLVILLVPFMAWWLSVSLIEAFVYDVAYALLFMVYTYVFNLGFDTVFGLPQSAR